MQNFIKSIFKFYRLNQRMILGGLGIALLVLVLMLSNTLYSNYRVQRSAETVAQVETTATPTPEIEKIDISQVKQDATATTEAKIATAGATTNTPRIVSPKPSATLIPTPQPTPRVTPSPSPSPKVSPSPTLRPSPTPVVSPSPINKPQVFPSPKMSPTPVASPSVKPTPSPITKTETDTDTNTNTYIVQKGDTLWDIAQNKLGSGEKYRELAKLNNLKSANYIEAGQSLQLTQKSVATDTKQDGTTPTQEQITKGGTVTETNTNPKANTYTVKSGDTLWSIAQTQLNDPYAWVKLYNANKTVVGSNPHLIYPGTTLHIPTHTAN